MSAYKLSSMLFGSVIAVAALPAVAQTTVGPGNITQIPPGAIFVNPTGQDTFISGGSNQTVNQAPTAQGGLGGQGGQGGRGGRAIVNNTVNALPPSIGGGGVGGTGGGVGSGGNGSSNAGGSGYPSTIRNTPSSTLALATAYCQNNAGLSGSGPGFSFGFAAGKHDIDCKRLNYAMLLGSLGMTQEAVLVIANNEEVNAAIWEAHRQRQEAPSVAQPVARRTSSLNPASDGDPRPSEAQCTAMRNLSDPSSIQKEYVSANCL